MTTDAPTTEFDPDPADDAEPGGFLPVLTSVIQRRWTSSVFGIVAPGAVRRRPSDVARILTAIVADRRDLRQRHVDQRHRGEGVRRRGRPARRIDRGVRGPLPARSDRGGGVGGQRPGRPPSPPAPHPAGGVRRRAGRRGAPLGAGRHHPGPEGRRNRPRRAQPGLPGRAPGRVHRRPPRRPALPHPPDPPHGRGRVLALRPRRRLPGRGPPRLGVGQHGPVVGSRRRRPLRLRLTWGDTRPPPGRRLPP